MTREQQREINRKVIARTVELINQKFRSYWRRPPSYHLVTSQLNKEGFRNSRGQEWNMKTFYLMLARNGYRGLYGLNQAYLEGAFNHQLSSISGYQEPIKT